MIASNLRKRRSSVGFIEGKNGRKGKARESGKWKWGTWREEIDNGQMFRVEGNEGGNMLSYAMYVMWGVNFSQTQVKGGERNFFGPRRLGKWVRK